jgi:branched-chain amino acid transport system permease protein
MKGSLQPRGWMRPEVSKLLRSRVLSTTLALVALIAALLSAPSYLPPYGLVVGFTLLTSITMAEAWNLVGGFGGQFSMAHSLFVGVGSYTTATLLVRTGWSLPLVMVFSGLLPAAIAAATGLVIMRLRSVYFSVASLGMALAVQAWMINWQYTGATSGLSFPGSDAPDENTLYLMAAGLTVVSTATVVGLVRSRFGLMLMAIRDDEDAAAGVGVRSLRIKVLSFTLSALIVGLVGSLIALQQVSIEPYSAFSFDWTINMIVISVLGGIGTWQGPIVGAIFVVTIDQLLEQYQALSTLIVALCLIAVVRLLPHGMWPGLRSLASLARRRVHVMAAFSGGLHDRIDV